MGKFKIRFLQGKIEDALMCARRLSGVTAFHETSAVFVCLTGIDEIIATCINKWKRTRVSLGRIIEYKGK